MADYAAERAAAVSFGAPEPPRTISDDDLIAHLRANPGRLLYHICARFDIPYLRDFYNPSEGYTDDATLVRNQLQRLRRRGAIRSDAGRRWYVRDV